MGLEKSNPKIGSVVKAINPKRRQLSKDHRKAFKGGACRTKIGKRKNAKMPGRRERELGKKYEYKEREKAPMRVHGRRKRAILLRSTLG